MSGSRWRPAALIGFGLLLIALPFLAAAGSDTVPDLAVVDRLAIGVALTLAVAVALRARPQDRSLSWGILLLATTFSAQGLTASANPWIFSLGLILSQLSVPLLVWIVLALPSGRLRSSWDRTLVLATLVTATVLWMPTQLFTSGTLFHDPLVPCGGSCPQSVFFISEHPEASRILAVIFGIVGGLVILAVGWTLVRRMIGSSRPTRRTLLPIFIAALLRVAVVSEFVLVERNPYSGLMLTVTYWLVPLSLMLGLLLGRLTAGRAMLRLVSGLERRPDADRLRDVMADALEDPGLAVYYWLPGRQVWAGKQGVVGSDTIKPAAGRAIRQVMGESGLIAAIDVDERLLADREPFEAVMATAGIAMEGNRALADLALSEARAETAEARARHDLERDLHDRAQQRLIALRMKASMLRSLLEQDVRQAGELAEELGPDIDSVLQEVRSVAHGDRPAALADGLAVALGEAITVAPVAVTLDCDGAGRYSPAVEEAVYLTCLEALQNVAKHAGPAASVQVRLMQTGEGLTMEVRDDGVGFDPGSVPSAASHGLAHMRERFAGCGGRLTLESSPGNGVTIRGTIPID